MKILIFSLIFAALPCFSADLSDKNCKIFVTDAHNVSAGNSKNFLSATLVVAKSLVAADVRSSPVKILYYESAIPTRIEDRGDKVAFIFDHYRPGIDYHGSTATVEAYVVSGTDRLFDRNENILLSQFNSWKFTSSHCR